MDVYEKRFTARAVAFLGSFFVGRMAQCHICYPSTTFRMVWSLVALLMDAEGLVNSVLGRSVTQARASRGHASGRGRADASGRRAGDEMCAVALSVNLSRGTGTWAGGGRHASDADAPGCGVERCRRGRCTTFCPASPPQRWWALGGGRTSAMRSSGGPPCTPPGR
eukprot:818831-Prorocentrum_minimum.AAC.2